MEARIQDLEARVTVLEQEKAAQEVATSEQLDKNTAKTSISTIEVGKLTNEQLKRFELGPYSKNNTPDSDSV